LPYDLPKFGTLRATQFFWNLSGEGAPKMGRAKSMNHCYITLHPRIARLYWNLIRWCFMGQLSRHRNYSQERLVGRAASSGNTVPIATF